MSLRDRFKLPPKHQDAPTVQPEETAAVDAAPVVPLAPPGDKSAYAAVEIEKQNRRTPSRLYIDYGNNRSDMPSYAFVINIICTSDRIISLVLTNQVITLEGHHLDQIHRDLQEHKVKMITCFNAKKHTPPEKGKPLIESIKWETLKDVAQRVQESDASAPRRAEKV